jgi:hypothetical protein
MGVDLDTASTVNVFCNKEFVRDVRKAHPLVVHTNAGTFTVQEKATLPWYDMDVWFDPHAITKVLSFAIVQEKFPVSYDNSKEDAFIIKTPRGNLVFKPLSKNLYVHKPKNQGNEEQASPEANMLNTLNENKSFFTNRQVKRAQDVRNLARALGCPSNADLKKVIRLNMIKDCPVVEEDVILSKKIFGKDVAVLKGKTTRTKPKPVTHDTIAIPMALKMVQKEVMLCINTFFINKMPFLHTSSD